MTKRTEQTLFNLGTIAILSGILVGLLLSTGTRPHGTTGGGAVTSDGDTQPEKTPPQETGASIGTWGIGPVTYMQSFWFDPIRWWFPRDTSRRSRGTTTG